MNKYILLLLLLFICGSTFKSFAQTDDKNRPQKQRKRSVLINPPLYILDGEIVDDISDLSADSIASIEVIKEKSAIIRYGERAKYGVIILKTKSKIE